MLFQHVRRNLVDGERIAPEHLGAQRRRNLAVTMLGGKRIGNLERPKGLDLVLRRAVPDRVGTP